MELTPEDKDLAFRVIDYYTKIGNPLARTNIADMVQDVVRLLPKHCKKNCPNKNYSPSFLWITC